MDPFLHASMSLFTLLYVIQLFQFSSLPFLKIIAGFELLMSEFRALGYIINSKKVTTCVDQRSIQFSSVIFENLYRYSKISDCTIIIKILNCWQCTWVCQNSHLRNLIQSELYEYLCTCPTTNSKFATQVAKISIEE